MRVGLGVLFCALVAVPAGCQSRFDGTWQTRVSEITHKAAIAVRIKSTEGKIDGSMTLLNPDGTEMNVPMLHPVFHSDVLEYQTDIKGTFYWSLTLKGGSKARLHGSFHEMIVDEPVTRRGSTPKHRSPALTPS